MTFSRWKNLEQPSYIFTCPIIVIFAWSKVCSFCGQSVVFTDLLRHVASWSAKWVEIIGISIFRTCTIDVHLHWLLRPVKVGSPTSLEICNGLGRCRKRRTSGEFCRFLDVSKCGFFLLKRVSSWNCWDPTNFSCFRSSACDKFRESASLRENEMTILITQMWKFPKAKWFLSWPLSWG